MLQWIIKSSVVYEKQNITGVIHIYLEGIKCIYPCT